MIRISISIAAFEAIAAALPSSVASSTIPRLMERDVWLEPRFADRLGAMRGPGESYSDVILRLAVEA